jgi:hypothetical protein
MTALLIQLLLLVKPGSLPDRAEPATHPKLGSRTIDQVDDYSADGGNKGGNCYDHQSEGYRGLVFLV